MTDHSEHERMRLARMMGSRIDTAFELECRRWHLDPDDALTCSPVLALAMRRAAIVQQEGRA